MTTAPTARWIDQSLLDAVSGEAAHHARRRKNFNFHPDDAAPAHRLLNAIEPGSYLPAHRHLDSRKDETIVVLRGRLGVLLFDDCGNVQQAIALTPLGRVCGIDIPHGVYHTLVSLEPETVMLEAKAGPYLPLAENERAPWAPPEGDPQAAAYLQRLSDWFSDG